MNCAMVPESVWARHNTVHAAGCTPEWPRISDPVNTSSEHVGATAGASPPSGVAVLADRVGATASLLCAVHCALLPFVLAALPLIGLGFLAGHTFERGFVVCAATLASASIVTAYGRHRRPHALFVLMHGVAIDSNAHVGLRTASVVTGGVLVASAHITNQVIAHRHAHHADCGHAGQR